MLLETIKQKCSCMRDINQEQFDILWSGFVRFLSNITCWDINGGTIEKCCRRQTIKLDKPFCSYNCIEVFPYWKNIDLDTVSVEVRQYSSRGMNVIPVDVSLFSYDDVADRFYIQIDEICGLYDTCDKNCTNNVVVMSYTAGYDLDSPEWLELICHYLTGYTAIVNDCISVNDCASINRVAVGATLVRKTVDTINYEWNVDQNSPEVFFSSLMKNFYIDYLGRFALCGRDYSIEENIYVGRSKC